MTNSAPEKPLQVLLVEDDAFDEFLTKKYLKKGLANYELHVVHDGNSALDFLRHQGNYPGEERPDLILLDIGLPNLDGSEVLNEIDKDSELKKIPVIVLTGKTAEGDSIQKLRLGEKFYMNKWINMGDFLALLKAVEEFRSTGSSTGPNKR